MKVLILGASTKVNRYAYMALSDLLFYGHDVLAVGKRRGEARGVEIRNELPTDNDIDTVTVYLGRNNQKPYENYLLSTLPRRVIFNPGAENDELEEALEKKGVTVLRACTLVMLRTDQF